MSKTFEQGKVRFLSVPMIWAPRRFAQSKSLRLCDRLDHLSRFGRGLL